MNVLLRRAERWNKGRREKERERDRQTNGGKERKTTKKREERKGEGKWEAKGRRCKEPTGVGVCGKKRRPA